MSHNFINSETLTPKTKSDMRYFNSDLPCYLIILKLYYFTIFDLIIQKLMLWNQQLFILLERMENLLR